LHRHSQLELSNQLKQKLRHSNNLPLQTLKPSRSQLKLKLNNQSLTLPVMTPATTTKQTITMEAKAQMLALEQVASLRNQPSNEPQRIACVS